MQIDSGVAALLGAIVGGLFATITNLIASWATNGRERLAFRRSLASQHLELVRETYSFALNVMFNMNRNGSPDRTTLGNVYAKVELFGSVEVASLVHSYVSQRPRNEELDLSTLVAAMKRHLLELETQIPTGEA